MEPTEQSVASHPPHGRPKNPLSAYNIFFQLERKRILSGVDHLPLLITDEDLTSVIAHHKSKGKRLHRKSHGKITFKDLARTVAERWKKISPENKAVLERHAAMEKTLFREKFRAWKNLEESHTQSGTDRKDSTNKKPKAHNVKTTKQRAAEQAPKTSPKLQPNQTEQDNFSRFRTLRGLLSQVETEISYLSSQNSAQLSSLFHGQAITQQVHAPQGLEEAQFLPDHRGLHIRVPCDHQTHQGGNHHAAIPPTCSPISATSLDLDGMIWEKPSHEEPRVPQVDPQAPMSLEPLPFHSPDQNTTPVRGSLINEGTMGGVDDPLDLSSTGEFLW